MIGLETYAAMFLFLIYECIIVQHIYRIAGMAAMYKYLFDPKEYIFIPRSQMFSQTLKPTFCQFNQFKCLTIFEMLFGQQFSDVHWEFITNVAKGTLDIQFHCLVKTKASTSIQNHDQPL